MASNAPAHIAETQAHGGAEHAAGVFPPFDSSHFASQLLWLAITFGCLYYLMSRIALPRVASILENRARRIDLDLASAKEAQAQAHAAEVAHAKTLSEARAQAQSMAQAAYASLATETDGKRKALEADLNAKIAASEAQIEEMKSRAMANVGSIASEAATAIIARLTGAKADSKRIAAAVSNVLKG